MRPSGVVVICAGQRHGIHRCTSPICTRPPTILRVTQKCGEMNGTIDAPMANIMITCKLRHHGAKSIRVSYYTLLLRV
jgi:hypothetical protein